MEFGICTFGDLAPGETRTEHVHERLDEVVAAARIADEAGTDVFGVVREA
ncbi:hypothetical protein [Caballeronia sp. LjRoot31]|jgi:hypothetical protein